MWVRAQAASWWAEHVTPCWRKPIIWSLCRLANVCHYFLFFWCCWFAGRNWVTGHVPLSVFEQRLLWSRTRCLWKRKDLHSNTSLIKSQHASSELMRGWICLTLMYDVVPESRVWQEEKFLSVRFSETSCASVKYLECSFWEEKISL